MLLLVVRSPKLHGTVTGCLDYFTVESSEVVPLLISILYNYEFFAQNA